MATKGYHQYRGRGRGGGKLPVILLLVVLLCAIVFLIGQRYIVYHDDGSVTIELPFFHQQQTDPGDIPDDDVHIEYEDPDPDDTDPDEETPVTLQALQAYGLPYGCLNSNPASLLTDRKAVAVYMKNPDGTLAYQSSVTLPQGVGTGSSTTLTSVQTITGSDCYTVARITALCDSAYAQALPESAIRYTGGSLWWDNYSRFWLDPGSDAAREYLCALAKECAQLGFDEIVLEQFRYPIEGDLSGTTAADTAQRAAALQELAQAIREAAGPSVAVSILLPGSIDTDYSFQASGLTAQMLQESFHRIYVPQGSAAYYWLDGALGADFDRNTRLVLTADAPLGSGSYLVNP